MSAAETVFDVEIVKSETITELELIALLSGLRGAKLFSITAETDARLKKTGNPYGKVTKISRVNVLVNFHYDAGVLRRLEKEGKSPESFKKGESWHVPVLTEDGKLTPFCQHPNTGELYLRVCVQGYGDTIYLSEAGERLTYADVEPWLPKREGAYGNQGLDAPLEFKVYKLSGIVEIGIDGQNLAVVGGI